MKDKILWTVFIAIIALDQLTKFLVLENYALGETREIIPNLFNLTLVYNPGAAFGIFADLPDTVRRAAIISVTVVALGVVFLMLRDVRGDTWSETALAGILAGAIGNIIDRFRFDSVVDFLDFYVGTYHWPAFNVADSAISVGVTLLIFRMVFFAPAPKKEGDGENGAKVESAN